MKELFEELQALTEQEVKDDKYYIVNSRLQVMKGPFADSFDAEEAQRASSIAGGKVMGGDMIKYELQYKELDEAKVTEDARELFSYVMTVGFSSPDPLDINDPRTKRAIEKALEIKNLDFNVTFVDLRDKR